MMLEGGKVLRVAVHWVVKSWRFIGEVLLDDVKNAVDVRVNSVSGGFQVTNTLVKFFVEVVLLWKSLLNCKNRMSLIWFVEGASGEGWIGTVEGCVGGAEGFSCDWFFIGVDRGTNLFLGGDFIRDLTWSAYWAPDFVGATDVWNWSPWFLWIPPNQIPSWGFKNALGSSSAAKSEQISDSKEDYRSIVKEWSIFWNTTIVIVLEKFDSTCWNRTGEDIPIVAGKLLRRDRREIWWYNDFKW